jgi:beta-N-acetylhexosaminidase
MTLATTCGQLVLGGFSGTSLGPEYARALREGRRSGAILFRHNVEGGAGQVRQVSALAREIHALAERPLVAIDQEGGKVARLRSPLLEVPAMGVVGAWGDEAFAERIASAVGAELAALGVTLNFAPVVDVHTRPENPIIGDRAFGTEAAMCARFGVAWIRGLQSAGVLATAKHFPGHGDTTRDSHLELPVVDETRERLDAVELVPFRAAAAAGVAAMMTAHVVYPSLDAGRPATLSPRICTELRKSIGFDGILVTDDLEMQAIAGHGSIDDAAVEAIAAGCDVALICHHFDVQERVFDALVRQAERSPSFRARCLEASDRVMRARRRATARPLDDDAVRAAVGGAASRAIQAELDARTSAAAGPRGRS